MEVERIFSAEQIQVHPDLSKIIREYTKAVIRENPVDLYIFSLRYFKEKVDLQMEKELLAEREREREIYEEGADTSRGDNQGGDDAN